MNACAMGRETFEEEPSMKRNPGARNASLFGLLTILAMAIGAGAQQQISALMTGMGANAKQLRQYTFKQRTETYYKGELKNAKIDEIHYDPSGERVSIPLDEQKAQSEPRRRGPGSRIIARKIEQKQEEIKEYVERLMALTGRYLAADPAKLQAAFSKADVTMAGGGSLVRITMRDYVSNGDVMTMSFDSATNRPTKTEVNTTLDDAPVCIVLAFDQIREGPNYPGRTVVRSDDKQVEVRVFTYDYRL
jgi:hypothetical protein